MAQLLFRCPFTNEPIRSGIEADHKSLQSTLDCPISIRCPYCGELHHGTIADGCLSDEPAGASPTLGKR